MKNKRVTIIAVSAVAVIAVLIITWFFIPENAQDVFGRDYKELNYVCEYLISLEDESHVYIESADGTMSLRFGDKETITDKKAIDSISYLFSKGYFKIAKNDDTIYFHKWKDPFGCFKGFAFSTNGSGELDIQFVTEIGELSKKDWYFYVSDYNEWRSMH